ncbi:MAG: SCP2 sterol-binding domain-containing protein [Alphaproteobacteria bacterium]|nr:SCP2 sterol-binding domain-containing protein [Alphaproteobacteria bacterium]
MSLEDITKGLKDRFEGQDTGLGKTFKIDLGDDGCVFIDATSAPNSVSNENKDADTTMKIAMDDFLKMQSGELDGQMAFMSGKLKIEGDLSGAMALGQYLRD